MTEAQIHRYARHISLGSVGARGQERLLDATVAVDASANPASHCAIIYMAASGIGRIGISGGDQRLTEAEVSTSLLFTPDDVGERRVDALRRHVAALNSDVELFELGDDAETLEIPAARSLAEGLRHGCAVAARQVASLAKGRS